jgi:hypothetical protein
MVEAARDQLEIYDNFTRTQTAMVFTVKDMARITALWHHIEYKYIDDQVTTQRWTRTLRASSSTGSCRYGRLVGHHRYLLQGAAADTGCATLPREGTRTLHVTIV